MRRVLILLAVIAISGCNVNNNEIYNLKAQWYLEALNSIRTKYTRIKIAVIWSEEWQNSDGSWSDLRVNSSPWALDAFREGISSNYYLGKEALPDSGMNILPPETGCFFGAMPGWGTNEDSAFTTKLDSFAQLVGKSVAFSPFSIFWGEYVDGDNFDWIAHNLNEISRYGAIPMVRLMPWGEPYWESSFQPRYSLQRIIDGDFDQFLTQIADIIRQFGKPVFITFAMEMNGNWFPWSGVFQGADSTTGYGDPDKPDGPERYVDAFRHVVEIFRQTGATNAIWYFQPNDHSYPETSWNSIENYYPGDDCVEWIGFSLYGAQTQDESWVWFDDIMTPIYQELTEDFPNKPLMLAEFGVMER